MSGNWTNKTYWFTTEAESGGSSPSGGSTPSFSGYTPPLIVENENPVANAGGSYLGYINVPLVFNGSESYDSDGEIESYDWDLGDGTTGIGLDVTKTYEKTGNYSLILTVTSQPL